MKARDIVPTGQERVMREDDFIVSKTDLKGRIMYGNKTVAVYKNSVKFSTAVTNWEFNAAANQIRYSIFMGSPGRPGFYD